MYKQTRENKQYTENTYKELSEVWRLVGKAFDRGIELGYSPTDIFYEVSSEAHSKFLMKMLSGK